MKKKTFLTVCLMVIFQLFAINMNAGALPKMKNAYVNDFAKILSNSELNQLRTDVKAMCDYYSTQIVVAIVPTFGGYSIDEYAEELSDHWNVAQEDGMLILVKPKTDSERGEAMMLASPDLKDVFPNSVCEEIVHENMIPHFKENDYFGGIEAVLEYMNNMSEDNDSSNNMYSQSYNYDENNDNGDGQSFIGKVLSGGLKLILIAIGAFIILFLFLKLKGMKTKTSSNKGNTQNSSYTPKTKATKFIETNLPIKTEEEYNDDSDDDDDDNDDDNAFLQIQIEEKKRQLQMKKKQEEKLRELERLDRELNQQNYYKEDYSENAYKDRDIYTRETMDYANPINTATDLGMGEGGLLKKVILGAVAVGGTALVLKNKDKIGRSVKSMFGDSGNNSHNKPRLGGGSGKPKLGGNGNKPRLGGGGNKPKLGGSSSSGSW